MSWRVGGNDRLLTTPGAVCSLLQSQELGPSLDQACTLVAEALGADKVDVFLYEAETDSLVARHEPHPHGSRATPCCGPQPPADRQQWPVGSCLSDGHPRTCMDGSTRTRCRLSGW